jgi:CheY-like chemotaxis protein
LKDGTKKSDKTPNSPQNGTDDWAFRAELSEKLRTPLNAIIGFAELLAMQTEGARKGTDLQHILTAARDLLGIIDRDLTNPADAPIKSQNKSAPAVDLCDVLYIEDDIVNFTLVERILEYRPNLSLKRAPTGQMGIELARSDRPKLVLLDLNLPDLHGSEVLQILQGTDGTKDIPVVVLSANATPSQIERLLTAGARNYLTKPFDIEPFLAVVDEFANHAGPRVLA